MVLLLLEHIVQLFLCLVLGWVLIRVGLLKPTDSRVLSVVCLYLVIPCIIVGAFQIDSTPELLQGWHSLWERPSGSMCCSLSSRPCCAGLCI